MKLKSLRSRFISSNMHIIVLLSLILSLTGVIIVHQLSRQDSAQLMSRLSEKETLRFDNKLTQVQNAVETVYEYAVMLQSFEGMEDIYSEAYCTNVREMALSIANRTEGAMAVYFRYNPELVGNGTEGFFWSRENDSAVFHYEPPTDILAYPEDDVEHVGWFYGPKTTGKPAWMSPYLNQNLDVFMISYIIPIYGDDGEFIGVIGMDIDFHAIMGLADDASLYETGKVRLADPEENTIYSSDLSGKAVASDMSETLSSFLNTNQSRNTILVYREDGEEKQAVCLSEIRNGMILMVSVPYSEINRNRNDLLLICLLVTLFMVLLSSLIILKRTKRIVDPILEITRVTNQYASGNWSESYICESGDELQTLSESISIMADTTQKYLAEMSSYAHTDALTGLRNHNCYLNYLKEMQTSGVTDYGLVLFDLNYLKKTNDLYGHEAGDELLINAGMYICSSFQFSPVFRIGGDEFAVILRGNDYEKRDQLLHDFMENQKEEQPLFEDVPLSIACGMALFPEDGNDHEAVFHAADERMYENKRKMKAERIN